MTLKVCQARGRRGGRWICGMRRAARSPPRTSWHVCCSTWPRPCRRCAARNCNTFPVAPPLPLPRPRRQLRPCGLIERHFPPAAQRRPCRRCTHETAVISSRTPRLFLLEHTRLPPHAERLASFPMCMGCAAPFWTITWRYAGLGHDEIAVVVMRVSCPQQTQ